MPNTKYTIKQCLQLSACTNCQACVDVCPAVQATEDGELSALYRMEGLKRILKDRSNSFLSRLMAGKKMSGEECKHFSETVFCCTLCGNCQEVCPVGIHLRDLWVSVREDMVASRTFPKKINMIKDNLVGSRNVFNEDNGERADWVEDLDDPPDDLFVKDRADVVYFTGCTAAYFPVAQKIPLALVEIFKCANVDFTLMGEDEWCCGFPLLGAGFKNRYAEFADHNIKAVKAKGATQVVFTCPSCYGMWKQYYRYKEHDLEIYHITQYLDLLIQEARIPFKTMDLTVTYHDPCDLGRGEREFDAPRHVMHAIPGLRLVELPNNRQNCTCCGGGGNLEMIDPGLSNKIAQNKIEEALSTGADTVVTSCQQCVRSMLTFIRRNKIPLNVLDITQLVRQALNGPKA
jgi:heterodisulfide reductase subunit D